MFKRFRSIHLVSLILHLGIPTILIAVVTFVSVLFFNEIADDAAYRIASQYSIEAASRFQLASNEHFVLMQQLARSSTIARWLQNYDDSYLKELAFKEIKGFANFSPHIRLMFTVYENRRSYNFDVSNLDSVEDWSPWGYLAGGEVSQWFYNTISNTAPFITNVQRDQPELHGYDLFIWTNHRIEYQGELVGVVTTSSSFEEIFKSVFGNFNFKNIRGYIIDENGYVRIDSALLVKTHENGIPIRPYPRIPETYYGSALQNAIDYHLTKISQETGIFEYREFTTTTTTTTTTTSLFKYASIFPIMGTEWSIVILSNYIGPLDSTLYFTMIIVSILSILVYISISSYITHKHLINPINKLKKSIENSSYTYDETHEENLIFGTDLKGEVGDIARTISKMRLDLKENLNELSLLEKSKELSDNKDKFFKMLTSRVSSPAKTLINIINAEEKNEKIPDDFKPVFSEINRIAFLLLNRLDSMTFLSKIEDDKEVVKAPKSYETAELVNDIVKISKFYLNKRPIKFEVSVDSQIPNSLIGYKRLLVLITTDLLSNSFNWTDDGGKVKLSFKFIPANNLEITIEDDGVGIDPDELKKLQEDLNLIKENKVKYLKSNSLELIQIMLNFLEGELSIQSELYKGTIIKIKIPQSLN